MLLFVGCSNNNDFTATYKCDIGAKGDWVNFTSVDAYGGMDDEYCSKVDSANEYSFGFRKLINEISFSPIKRIKVGVSVKLEDITKKCMLVVVIVGPNNENIFWSGHDLNPMVSEANKWCTIDVEDVLPEYKADGASACIYVWNPNKNVAYIDNFEIKFFQK